MAKDNKNPLKRIADITSNLVYGRSGQISDELDSLDIEIKNKINDVKKTYQKETGSQIIEFLNALSSEKLNNKVNGKDKPFDKDFENNVKKILENPDTNLVSDILYSDKDRIIHYPQYNLIDDNIPQVAEALNVITDNIISPDDFTKNSLNIFLNNEKINLNDNNLDSTLKKIKDLLDNYSLHDKKRKIIRNTLKFGDEFIAVLDLETELKKRIITESEQIFKSNLSYNDIILSDHEAIELESLFNAEKYNQNNPISILSESKELSKVTTSWKKEISKLINENITFNLDSTQLTDESENIEKILNRVIELKNNKTVKSKSKEDDSEKFIRKAVYRQLDRSKIIKLQYDDINFGYLYLESNNLEVGKSFVQNNLFTSTNFNQLSLNNDPRLKFIERIFTNNIAKKMNMEFVKNNKEFANIVYTLLKNKELINNNIKITFLTDDEVIHFKVGEKKQLSF